MPRWTAITTGFYLAIPIKDILQGSVEDIRGSQQSQSAPKANQVHQKNVPLWTRQWVLLNTQNCCGLQQLVARGT